MRAALLQLTSSDDPGENRETVRSLLREAAAEGAQIVCTPEVTNCVSQSRTRQKEVLSHEDDDIVLAMVREEAARAGVWVSLGSIAVKTGDADGRFANRSLLVTPDGEIAARYDKAHMFDVEVSETETYRESAGYRPGTRLALAETPIGPVGLSVCYDLRFPYLYRRLAHAGAEVLLVPSAFSPVTGAAHWEPLLRARAIECGAWVLAAAQTGGHRAERGKARRTYGHAMAVSPWGEVVLDMGTEPGIGYVEIDRGAVAEARRKVPSLTHDKELSGP
ncbi:carbon-nitrogen hydrolase family protein [Histidinibacterium aquaticum]|uniref:Carbon-nitrogen hydrolase family protein n=1 Tax=Histidinibacterium aquaticum TaxID=2613962 RepID=A0A5J5GFF4_9RHOB|nr:carbon-nitrogen hydrolase family protein [Histidinibacterium aquaticum]KAA9006905.1 carbon-nitrogen hydrolase family protein [Histidinibacterium aquaticum]